MVIGSGVRATLAKTLLGLSWACLLNMGQAVLLLSSLLTFNQRGRLIFTTNLEDSFPSIYGLVSCL
jgi:hypothetical protein